MYTLGIETSCDDTAVSIVKNYRTVLSNVVSSSIKFHKKYGGVIPEIAARHHLETISYTLNEALKSAGIKLKDIDLISVTSQPGLKGSLLVGLCFAKALSLGLNIPLIQVDHLYSHIYAAFLQPQKHKSAAKQTKKFCTSTNFNDSTLFPFVSLVVSGGHTSLFYVKDFSKIQILGFTLDDACGEAFDKVAKILGLGYPGGPLIERAAKKGNPKKINFPRIQTKGLLDFSFSGIKTAVLYYLRDAGYVNHLPLSLVSDIAASFQDAAIDTLLEKAFLACHMKRAKVLTVGGGVAANNRLREKFNQQAKERNVKAYFSSLEFCTDNAAMVAGLGQYIFKKDASRN